MINAATTIFIQVQNIKEMTTCILLFKKKLRLKFRMIYKNKYVQYTISVSQHSWAICGLCLNFLVLTLSLDISPIENTVSQLVSLIDIDIVINKLLTSYTFRYQLSTISQRETNINHLYQYPFKLCISKFPNSTSDKLSEINVNCMLITIKL
jgi:hypothetical protein